MKCKCVCHKDGDYKLHCEVCCQNHNHEKFDKLVKDNMHSDGHSPGCIRKHQGGDCFP